MTIKETGYCQYCPINPEARPVPGAFAEMIEQMATASEALVLPQTCPLHESCKNDAILYNSDKKSDKSSG
jgi:hypothetical protein